MWLDSRLPQARSLHSLDVRGGRHTADACGTADPPTSVGRAPPGGDLRLAWKCPTAPDRRKRTLLPRRIPIHGAVPVVAPPGCLLGGTTAAYGVQLANPHATHGAELSRL